MVGTGLKRSYPIQIIIIDPCKRHVTHAGTKWRLAPQTLKIHKQAWLEKNHSVGQEPSSEPGSKAVFDSCKVAIGFHAVFPLLEPELEDGPSDNGQRTVLILWEFRRELLS